MKKTLVITGLLIGQVSAVFAQALECRTWTTKKGEVIEGTLAKCYTDAKTGKEVISVILKETSKGRGLTVKQLSDADKAYLDQQIAAGLVPKE